MLLKEIQPEMVEGGWLGWGQFNEEVRGCFTEEVMVRMLRSKGKNQRQHQRWGREQVQRLGGQNGWAVFRNRRKDREAAVQG